MTIKDGKCLTCGAISDCCCMNWIGKPGHGVGVREKIEVPASMTWEEYGKVLEGEKNKHDPFEGHEAKEIDFSGKLEMKLLEQKLRQRR